MKADVVQVSHPDKVFYPDSGITKGEVVEHYRAVADDVAYVSVVRVFWTVDDLV